MRLARVDRPTGFWLLAIPCFWSVALASRSIGADYPDAWLLVLFAIGAVVMRAAGCTYNDIVDKDIDAKVARTQSRPLPSGEVSERAATIFMLVLCLIGLAVLLSFNAATIWLGLCVVPLVAALSAGEALTATGRRRCWGLPSTGARSSAIPPCSAASNWPAVVLYAGAIAWTIGYDTIYAHQDRDDDALLGLKSTALKFGRATKAWLAGFYALAWLGITVAGLLGRRRDRVPAWHGGRAVPISSGKWPRSISTIRRIACRRFRSNRDFGLIVFAAIVFDLVLASRF